MTDLVLTDRSDDGVVTITLNQPERRNPLSTHMIAAVHDAIVAAVDAPAIVLASSGAVWSTGHDLKQMSTMDEGELRGLFSACTAMMRAIEQSPQPIVAKVHALATAAGCQLVATCDIAVAAESAGFATPGGKGGLFCHTPMVAVALAVGRKRAAELAFTGDVIDAATALDWGLVNEVVADAELDAATDAMVARLVRGSRSSKAVGKQTLYRQMDLATDDAYDLAVGIMAANAATGDGAEGIRAFAEKRHPDFTHRG